MRTQYLIIFLIASLSAISGCGRSQSPEQQQADSLVIKARDGFGNGSYRESLEHLDTALALNIKLNRPQKIGEVQRLLGDIASAAAQFDSALARYSRAIEQYRSVADREAVHLLTLEMAGIHQWIGEERKAFSIYTEALRLAKVFEDPVAVRETEWAMLPVCRALDDRDEESRILTDLLRDATATGSLLMQARTSFESGISSLYRGNHGVAEESFLRALTLSDQSQDSLLAISTLLKLAMTYTAARRIPEAFQMYTDGLKRADVTLGAEALREEMLIRVGNIYLRNKQYSDAGLFYRTALNSTLNTYNKIAEGYLTIQFGHLAEANADAISHYRSAFDLFNNFSHARGSAYALTSLGMATQRAGKFSEAMNYFKAAIEQEEASVLQRACDDLYAECESSSPRGIQSAYDMITELLLQSGRYDEAFWYMVRKRERAAYDDFGPWEISSRNDTLTEALARFSHQRALQLGAERQRERILTANPQHYEMLREVQTSFTGAARDMAATAAHVVRVNKAFETMVTIRSLGIGEVQKLLPQGVVLVSHFPAAQAVYTFAISKTRTAVQVASIERGRAISLTREFAELLRTREAWKDSAAPQVGKMDRQIEDLAAILYGTFVRPIEKDIEGATALIIIPREEFSSLPIHALRPYSGRSPVPYLAERYSVSYLPSATGLLFGRQRSGARGTTYDIVGIGHPGESSWDVEYELRDIRAFYKEARLYFDQQATIARLQGEHGDVLHIAAQVQCSFTPGNSALLLSDGKSVSTTKQVLFGELFSLPAFSTVILSELGNQCAGVETHLPQIFLTNGSTAVIMNSYTPARKTKKFFGEIFYTALLGGSTPEAAFRQTQLEMIKNREYSSPYLWAPFVLWARWE